MIMKAMPLQFVWLLVSLVGLIACRAAPSDVAELATVDAPDRLTATLTVPDGPPIVENDAPVGSETTLFAAAGPPIVENDLPAGICEDTANILSRVERVEPGLFRAVAVDNRAGSNDGDGIRGVRFAIVGEGVAYAHDELDAPFCIFGSNEPDCGEWPRDEAGRYTWGVGGPAVQPGTYEVFVEVVGQQADSQSGRDRCDWSFVMIISAP